MTDAHRTTERISDERLAKLVKFYDTVPKLYWDVRAAMHELQRLRSAPEPTGFGAEPAGFDREPTGSATKPAGFGAVPCGDQAPIARATVHNRTERVDVKLYAPGLPVGEHDLYCVPVAPEPRGDLPTARDDAELELVDVTEERDHLRVALREMTAARDYEKANNERMAAEIRRRNELSGEPRDERIDWMWRWIDRITCGQCSVQEGLSVLTYSPGAPSWVQKMKSSDPLPLVRSSTTKGAGHGD